MIPIVDKLRSIYIDTLINIKMKKITHLLVLSLVACAMMTACEKEPIEDDQPIVDDTTGATEDADLDILENTVRVTFNGSSWDAADYRAIFKEYAGKSVAQLLAQKDAGAYIDATHTVRVVSLAREGVEKATAEYQSNDITEPSFSNDNILSCDYFAEDYVANPAGDIYGNWWAKKVKWDVRDFDATSLQMQVVVDAEMFDATAFLVDGVPFEEASTADLKVEANVVLVTKE